MRADYDSKADTLAIDLEAADCADYGDDETHRAAVVHIAGDRPVAFDVLGAGEVDLDEVLAAVAQRYALDVEALTAAARSALAAPDRVVELAVRARTSA